MRTTGELVLKVCFILLGQDVLNEQKHQIAQLLKERELERDHYEHYLTRQAENIHEKLKKNEAEYNKVSEFFLLIFIKPPTPYYNQLAKNQLQ